MVLAETIYDPRSNPDAQKVTESVDHREAVDLIAYLTMRALGTEKYHCVRDLNWYPTANPKVYMAPDIMVLPQAVLPPHAKSYRQHDLGGPPPLVAVEIPPESNTVSGFKSKIRKINGFGTIVYVVDVEVGATSIERYDTATSIVPQDWDGKPIPELGGISLTFVDGFLQGTGHDGVVAQTMVEIADRVAEQAQARAEALEAQLRELGHDPTV